MCDVVPYISVYGNRCHMASHISNGVTKHRLQRVDPFDCSVLTNRQQSQQVGVRWVAYLGLGRAVFRVPLTDGSNLP